MLYIHIYISARAQVQAASGIRARRASLLDLQAAPGGRLGIGVAASLCGQLRVLSQVL
jgi:hypothetical protein